MKRLPIFFTLLAVIALVASLVYWYLQFSQPPPRPQAAAAVAVVQEPAPDAATGLFGGQVATVVVTNYQLKGVVAPARGVQGVAIISADGKPAMVLGVGKEVAPGVTVTEVQSRFVTLSEGGVIKRLELVADTKAGANLASPLPGDPQAPPPQNAPPTKVIGPPPSPTAPGANPTE